MVQESENDSPEEVFTYAESKEEEEARIAAEAAEAAARAQEEAAAKAGTGQAIVDFASTQNSFWGIPMCGVGQA